MNNIGISRALRVGLFFIFASILTWITYETLTESNLYSEYGYEINAPFEDLRQLKIGGDVRLAGVSIGAVTDVRLEGVKAVAVLNIEGDFLVPADSVATITTAGLLGNNYVAIHTGKSRTYLSDGDNIRTEMTPDITAVVGKISDLGDRLGNFLDAFSGENKGPNLFGNMNSFFDDVRPKINAVLDNMVLISDRIAQSEGTLGKLINEDGAYDKLLAAIGDIQTASKNASDMFDEAKGMINQFQLEDGPINFLLNDKEAAERLQKSVANVHEFSEKLNNDNSSLGHLISDDKLYRRADNVLTKVEGAVEGVENSGPITAVGVATGVLF